MGRQQTFLVSNQINWRVCVMVLVLGLAGCAIAPQDESSVNDEGEGLPAVVAPPTTRAVDRLITEAQGHMDAGQWEGAIASAERGLRIDRREPQLYYILAKSYYGLKDNYRAKQFAEQGMRYVQNPSSDLALLFQQLTERIDGR